MAELLQALPVVIGRGQVAVARAAFEGLLAQVPAVLAKGEGLTRERLAAALRSDAPPPASGRGGGYECSTRR